MKTTDLQEFLDIKYHQFNRLDFIESDPVSIPHQFSKKEDIEIAGFLSATIAWGQRVTIINNANKLMKMMGNSPHDFILHANSKNLKPLESFVHRTFNGVDLVFFIQSLQQIYLKHGGLEAAFIPNQSLELKSEEACLQAIMAFRNLFFSLQHPERSTKHVSNPSENSSSKRLCMFLRWMIRTDKHGVDFGIWKKGLKPADLMCPLDVHTGNVGRKLGLLKRTQNDWKAVEELTKGLRILDPADPVKYDFALFGLGVFEKF